MLNDCAEELQAKWCCWDELPHTTLGCFPPGPYSQDHAAKCEALWKRDNENSLSKYCHRLSWRWFAPDNGMLWPRLFSQLSLQGTMQIEK